jgi:hypothetical protein
MNAYDKGFTLGTGYITVNYRTEKVLWEADILGKAYFCGAILGVSHSTRPLHLTHNVVNISLRTSVYFCTFLNLIVEIKILSQSYYMSICKLIYVNNISPSF